MGSSGDRLCQTSPIPRSPDGDNKWKKVKLEESESREGVGTIA